MLTRSVLDIAKIIDDIIKETICESEIEARTYFKRIETIGPILHTEHSFTMRYSCQYLIDDITFELVIELKCTMNKDSLKVEIYSNYEYAYVREFALKKWYEITVKKESLNSIKTIISKEVRKIINEFMYYIDSMKIGLKYVEKRVVEKLKEIIKDMFGTYPSSIEIDSPHFHRYIVFVDFEGFEGTVNIRTSDNSRFAVKFRYSIDEDILTINEIIIEKYKPEILGSLLLSDIVKDLFDSS